MSKTLDLLEQQIARASTAGVSLIALSSQKKNELLSAIAEGIVSHSSDIEAANALDIAACSDKPQSFIDRLRFTGDRILSAADGLRALTKLPDPVGRTLDERTLYNGLKLKKITVPMGTVAIIYEARPNVTVDTAGLCIKSGNVAILRGSTDASHTNRAIEKIIRAILTDFGVDENAVSLIECDHDGIKRLLQLNKYIDLAIPRGSKSLIDFVRDNATVPVIETGAGNCCAYIDSTANISLATKAIINAKTQRISVCNALESLIIERKALKSALPVLSALADAGVTVHGDSYVCDEFDRAVAATDDDWAREYLSMDISVCTVGSEDEAIGYINNYGTHHSDVIFSTDKQAIQRFYNLVDSAVVYSNTSTRFTDGGEFGLGAEIGISTQKLHARGPMGLNEIVTYKYVVEGDGQIR